MKKLLILAGVIGLMSTTQVFAQDVTTKIDQPQGPIPMTKCDKPTKGGECHKMRKHHDFKKFEEALNLTEEQKAKAKAIRDNEKEQIKPILEKIGEKYKEQKEIMDKRLTFDERQQELAPIRKEIRELRGEIHKIMKDNAKKEFKKARKDGRHPGWDKRRPMGPKFGCPCPKPPVDVQEEEQPLEPPTAVEE